ncbi:MAG: methyl-accepting chemotaxis protein [Clostridiales bacterium]|jgi:methyl-accepting chemotaxis protein|nr:methyl-accepting chemotaxis protein [Clostridiales bacterium]
MNWFRNLKIRMKLALGFGLVLILLLGIAAYSVYTAFKIDADYSYMDEYPAQRLVLWSEVESRFHAIRRSASHSGFFFGRDNHLTNVESLKTALEQDIAALDDALSQIKTRLQNDPRKAEDERVSMIASVDSISGRMTTWYDLLPRAIVNAFLAGDQERAVTAFTENAAFASEALAEIQANYARSTSDAADLSVSTTASSQTAIIVLVVISAITLIFGVILALIITGGITRPIGQLVHTVNEVADGRLSVNIDRERIAKDEIGILTSAVIKLIDTILLIVSSLEQMSGELAAGDIEARTDAARFKGSYKEVAESVNNMVGELVGETIAFMDCISEFGSGNFKADMKKLPGKKALMNRNVDTLRVNLTNVADEINSLVTAAADGNLNNRIDAKKYKGDWAALLSGLNALMEAVAKPIKEAADVLKYVAEGNFDNRMEGNYHGEFLAIKRSVNDTVTNVASYIDEISAVLDALAQNDLNQHIKREYVGKFSNIKESLLNIIATFNRVIADILAAADQVAAGSKSISESSMTLAQGASEQASSVEELNATVQTINESTHRNADNAKEAENLSVESKASATQGDADMNMMLKAMDDIKESSNGISNIIKTIDNIAFQTNLLALNASVEAARAGEHGKGFAVVADEVRSLASRSQSNAQETALLIDESISRVNEGMVIAQKTAETLRTIIESVSKVSNIITGITAASQEQAFAIGQVMEGINQITEVVQSNSATSEESASASEELSSQADVLKGLVETFKLRG